MTRRNWRETSSSGRWMHVPGIRDAIVAEWGESVRRNNYIVQYRSQWQAKWQLYGIADDLTQSMEIMHRLSENDKLFRTIEMDKERIIAPYHSDVDGQNWTHGGQAVYFVGQWDDMQRGRILDVIHAMDSKLFPLDRYDAWTIHYYEQASGDEPAGYSVVRGYLGRAYSPDFEAFMWAFQSYYEASNRETQADL